MGFVEKIKKLMVGREVFEKVDSKPMALPVNYKRPPTLAEQVARLVRSEQLKQAAQNAGNETFEESDDFDIGDDFDPSSPYEEQFETNTNADRLKAELRAAKQPRTKFNEETPNPSKASPNKQKKNAEKETKPADDAEDQGE